MALPLQGPFQLLRDQSSLLTIGSPTMTSFSLSIKKRGKVSLRQLQSKPLLLKDLTKVFCHFNAALPVARLKWFMMHLCLLFPFLAALFAQVPTLPAFMKE